MPAGRQLVGFLLCLLQGSRHDAGRKPGGHHVLYYALVFLIVGLIAGALGVYGVASVASQIAWVLFVIAIVLFVVHLLSGWRRPVI
jgi:uncharacterized membrane protein YtjA (UPF0391 family)